MTTETNTERLEQLRFRQTAAEKSITGQAIMSLDLIAWAVQQAERVQELEKSIKGFAVAVEVYSEMPVDEAMNQLIELAQEDSL